MSKNILSFIIPVAMIMILATPFFISAQEGCNSGTGEGCNSGGTNLNIKIENPFKQNTIEGLINTIINDILIPIGSVVAVLMIMYAGFLYVTAGGDPGQIKKAHDALKWAVIGAAILLGAKVISDAISVTISQLKKP